MLSKQLENIFTVHETEWNAQQSVFWHLKGSHVIECYILPPNSYMQLENIEVRKEKFGCLVIAICLKCLDVHVLGPSFLIHCL